MIFPAITDDFSRFALVGLWAIWSVCLFGGMAIGRLNADHTHRSPTWMRIASSSALVTAGAVWWINARGTGVEGFAVCVAVGMALGFLGDLFMARLLAANNYVMGGIGAFGLGHLAYIAACLLISAQLSEGMVFIHWWALAAWLAFGAAGWYLVVFRGQQATALHWAALPYALLLATTAGLATSLALSHGAFASMALGAALFLFSDLLLAAQLFSGLHFKLIGDVVWALYGPGQMLIVYSIHSALGLSA